MAVGWVVKPASTRQPCRTPPLASSASVSPADRPAAICSSVGRWVRPIEEADFAGAGVQQVGHLREAGEVEVAYGDVHAVGVGVGVGAEVGGEVGVVVGVEDGHSGLPRQG